jgi:hypothetical protein
MPIDTSKRPAIQGVAYEFTKTNGTKVYEDVKCTLDIARACERHGAMQYRPVNPAERVPMFRTEKEI